MFFYSLAIFFVSFLFSLTVFWMRSSPVREAHHSHGLPMLHLDGLTDGIFLGIALFEFMPHAFHSAHHLGISRVYIFFGIVLASQSMRIIGSFYQNMSSKDASCKAVCCPSDFRDSHGLIWPGLLMLAIHALFEGMALGIVKEEVFQTLLFSSIFIHKGLESMAFSNAAYNAITHKAYVVLASFAFAALTPIGVFVGVKLMGLNTNHLLFSMVLNMLSASMFIYMGLHCLLPSKKDNNQLISVVIGIVVVGALTIFLHPHHH